MKNTLTVPLLSALLLAVLLTPVSAHEYDRNDSDNPLRIVAYIVHPIGVVLEHAIARPVHKLAHKSKNWAYVLGHQLTRKKRPMATVPMVVEPLDEIPVIEIEAAAPAAVDENVLVEKTKDGVRYSVVGDAVLFRSGFADLTPEGKVAIQKLADIIKEKYPDNELVVEGHTDSQPIKHSGWKSNWELGSARSMTLVRYLVDEAGFKAENIAALSRGEFQNVKPNDSPENMLQNRRAVITVKIDD